MARLPRLVIPNQPMHIMHRGNNHQDIFITDKDMFRIKKDIEQGLKKINCRLHAYVIMTNHLHLLITPEDKEQLSAFMQIVANRYVRYFNSLHNRTGTIWEGRYKSSIIDSEHYLLRLYRYIEVNPVRAKMVKNLDDYQWSSYHFNGLGKVDSLITEHECYKALGLSAETRRESYRGLLAQKLSNEEDINRAVERGEVYGDDRFHNYIAGLVERPTRLSLHGGDRKSQKFKEQAG